MTSSTRWKATDLGTRVLSLSGGDREPHLKWAAKVAGEALAAVHRVAWVHYFSGLPATVPVERYGEPCLARNFDLHRGVVVVVVVVGVL